MLLTQVKLSTTQATVNQVPKYKWSIGGMSVAYWSTCWPTIGQPLSVDTSTDTRPICWSICRPTSDRYIGRCVYRHIGRVAVYISTEISVVWRSTYWPIYRSICWPIRCISTEGCKDPRKLGHFFKNVIEGHCWSKGSCWRDTVFWVTSSFAWNCFQLFFQCSQD